MEGGLDVVRYSFVYCGNLISWFLVLFPCLLNNFQLLMVFAMIVGKVLHYLMDFIIYLLEGFGKYSNFNFCDGNFAFSEC